ncbi:hypothetical protein L1049_004803 [Liquidambar formosana]|uniref:Uncharacterized protein n=1 Tax=Liquidambar formosana TaxID=63359 RepID=A0AAP0RUE3_LIQFO
MHDRDMYICTLSLWSSWLAWLLRSWTAMAMRSSLPSLKHQWVTPAGTAMMSPWLIRCTFWCWSLLIFPRRSCSSQLSRVGAARSEWNVSAHPGKLIPMKPLPVPFHFTLLAALYFSSLVCYVQFDCQENERKARQLWGFSIKT